MRKSKIDRTHFQIFASLITVILEHFLKCSVHMYVTAPFINTRIAYTNITVLTYLTTYCKMRGLTIKLNFSRLTTISNRRLLHHVKPRVRHDHRLGQGFPLSHLLSTDLTWSTSVHVNHADCIVYPCMWPALTMAIPCISAPTEIATIK